MAKVKEQEFENFKALRLFPLSKSKQFITLYDEEENEIGVLKNYQNLDSHSLELLELELEKNYFIPEIKSIYDVERVDGNWKWEVDTDKGGREFTVRSRTRDIRKLDNGDVVIKDADGNRFRISVNNLDGDSVGILLKHL